MLHELVTCHDMHYLFTGDSDLEQGCSRHCLEKKSRLNLKSTFVQKRAKYFLSTWSLGLLDCLVLDALTQEQEMHNSLTLTINETLDNARKVMEQCAKLEEELFMGGHQGWVNCFNFWTRINQGVTQLSMDLTKTVNSLYSMRSKIYEIMNSTN